MSKLDTYCKMNDSRNSVNSKYDLTSLNTSIPAEKLVEMIKNAVEKDKKCKKHTLILFCSHVIRKKVWEVLKYNLLNITVISDKELIVSKSSNLNLILLVKFNYLYGWSFNNIIIVSDWVENK